MDKFPGTERYFGKYKVEDNGHSDEWELWVSIGMVIGEAKKHSPIQWSERWAYELPDNSHLSIIRGSHTYGGRHGLFEIAHISSDGDFVEIEGYEGDNVVGHLTESEVVSIIDSLVERKKNVQK